MGYGHPGLAIWAFCIGFFQDPKRLCVLRWSTVQWDEVTHSGANQMAPFERLKSFTGLEIQSTGDGPVYHSHNFPASIPNVQSSAAFNLVFCSSFLTSTGGTKAFLAFLGSKYGHSSTKGGKEHNMLSKQGDTTWNLQCWPFVVGYCKHQAIATKNWL